MAIREFPVGGLSVLVDAVGQETKRFGCYSLSEADTNYAAATSVAGNTVQEQIEQAYDTAGNVTDQDPAMATLWYDRPRIGTVLLALETRAFFPRTGLIGVARADDRERIQTQIFQRNPLRRGHPGGGASLSGGVAAQGLRLTGGGSKPDLVWYEDREYPGC